MGYLQKRSQAEQWIVTEQDLEIMYAQSGEKNSLWCDHRVEDPTVSTGTKRSSPNRSTNEAPPAKQVQKSTTMLNERITGYRTETET